MSGITLCLSDEGDYIGCFKNVHPLSGRRDRGRNCRMNIRNRDKRYYNLSEIGTSVITICQKSGQALLQFVRNRDKRYYNLRQLRYYKSEQFCYNLGQVLPTGTVLFHITEGITGTVTTPPVFFWALTLENTGKVHH